MPGTRLLDVRAALAALGLAMLAALAVAVLTHLPVPAPAAPNAPATHGSATGLSRLQSLPLQAQSVISSTLGGGSRDFAARRIASGWGLSGGGVRADFASGVPTLTAGGRALSLSLTGAGAPSSLSAHGNRVTLTRPGIREWYTAGPLGIEQGFTLAHRPAALATGHQLTLSLAVGGALRAQSAGSDVTFVNGDGQAMARYGGLSAVDASGRHLPATLSVSRGQVRLNVNDHGARYPITIDPLVQQVGAITALDESGAGNGSRMGMSVAVSADGNTAIAGGGVDNHDLGAAWVFTRSGSTWTQQGTKLVPSDHAGNSSEFGVSVALSADGNTALIGGSFDNGFIGAAWVFTRSGATWSQQGLKLTGAPGENGSGNFGQSVALSGDGTVALVGAPADNNGAGAAWLFTRSGSTWTQRQEINPPDRFPASLNTISNIGTGVALSNNGSVAMIGGPSDNGNGGATWVFTRPSTSSTTWTEATKIGTPVDEAAPQASGFGNAISLSSDGTIALVGGDNDGSTGAAWVFTGSGSNWNEQTKITGNGANGGPPNFGVSVSLSADGTTAAVGAASDDSNDGAVYVFRRSGTSWLQDGSRLKASGATGSSAGSGVALASDGNTLIVGAPGFGNSGIGAIFAFSPPDPVCSSVAANTPQGGGSALVSLSCTLPFGAHPAFSILGGPSNGSVSGFNTGTGQLTYTSNAFFSGQDSFTFRVSDQWGISNIATATLTVPFLPVPTCSTVSARAKRGGTRVTITLKCKGPAGHPFTYGIVSKPSNGRLGKINQSNGKVTYTTHIGFSGSDRFVYNATDSGGSSAATTATVVFPRLGRITSTMTWPDFTTGPTSSVVHGLIIKNLPGGAKVKLSCSKGCPIKSRTVALAKHRVCKGKGGKRKCKLAAPKVANLDLTRYVAHARIKVGGRITVAMIQSGSIGKEYVFTMIKNNQPSVKIQTLAPGSTKLCPGC